MAKPRRKSGPPCIHDRPTLNYVSCPTPPAATAWPTGCGAPRRRTSWSARTACRARAATSTRWPGAGRAQPAAAARRLPDVVGPRPQRLAGRPEGYAIPRTRPTCCSCWPAACRRARPHAGLGRHQHGRPDRHGAGRHAQLPLPVPVRRLVLNDVGPVIQWSACSASAPTWATPAASTRCSRPPMRCGRSRALRPAHAGAVLACRRPWFKPLAGRPASRCHYDPQIAGAVPHGPRPMR
jgi:hypothetical protein